MDPVASSIDELAIQAGQYIDEVIKEREKIKPKLPDTASTPREGASPASTPKLTNDNSPSTNHLDNKTPTATSRTSTTASAKATVTGFDHAPDESQQNATDDATTAFMNMNGTSAPNSKNDSKQNQESMVWSGFGEDTDQDGGAFDDVLSGLTADDFSFFDIPALPNSDPNPGSNIFSNLFDDSNNLSADNLFGEATGGFFASSPQSNFSKSPATQAAPTTQSPDLNTLLPRSGADTHHNGLSLESDVSDQTAASPNFSQLFGMSPATVNSPYKTPFTPFSAEDPTPPPAAAAVFARSNYPGQLPTGPAAASTRIEWDASGLDRFGPLLFKTPISTSIDSRLGIIQLYQDDDTAKKASRSKNKKVKKAARSAFLRPLPFEPGILKRGDRPNLWKPADISIKKPPSLDDSDSDSEFERPTISPITPVLHVVDSLDEKPSPKDSELVLSMHLLALHSFRSLPSCTADGSRCISESALPYPVLAATTLEYLHFCKALAPKALRCDSKTEVPFSHPIIRMPDIEHGSLLALERPRILAARGESVVSADMESLRIWNTLAFKPLSGIKNVMALALADLTLEDVAKECMRTLSIAYTVSSKI